jgi:hypothetical protein
VTDAGLRSVAGLPQVTVLYLVGDAFTDAGLLRLQAMRGLRFLHLIGCRKVTTEGVERLRKALPDCRIVSSP